jgi:regulator of protease activity HflC (stomatin/prohibitin superfamily)
MKKQENAIFWGGVILIIFLFSIFAWPLLALSSWYVKRVPEKRLPMTTLLSGNQNKFYDWLADFLRSWLKTSIATTIVLGIIEIILGSIILFASVTFKLTAFGFLTTPVFLIAVAYLTIVMATLYALNSTKYMKWEVLFWQAEPTVKVLVGNEEYEAMTDEDKNRVKRNIVDSMVGINKATLVIAGGKINTHNPPAGELARFGGTGVLIVQEGHAVVLERGGRRSRIVGTGVWPLGMFERVNMVVPLAQRTVPIEVENVTTGDQVVIPKIKLLAFTKLDPGDRSHANGDYPFEDKVINDLVWSPKVGPEVFDWSGAVNSIAGTAMRDLVARLLLDDLILASGAARENLRTDLKNAINRITKDKLGVAVSSVVIGEIIIPDAARQSLLDRWLADVNRRTTLINAEAEREKKILYGEGEAQAVRRIGLAKTGLRDDIVKLLVQTMTEISKTGSPIADTRVAVRYVAAIERLSALVLQDNSAALEYVGALEKLCESPSARTIVLGNSTGSIQLPDMNKP